MGMTLDLSGLKVVDADTHLIEVGDLWTSRAPAGVEDRVPHVEDVGGEPTWVMEGTPLGPAFRGSVIARDGAKTDTVVARRDFLLEDVHQGAFDISARLAMMDQAKIWAQVVFPNNLGLGGQSVANATTDRALLTTCVEIYNDFTAEMQEQSGGRLLPMAVMPAWDVGDCMREARRAHSLGFRGVNITADPSDQGAPDLADRAWDPLWGVCEELALPVHFHIGNSDTAMSFYDKYFWPSQTENVQWAIGGTMLFIGNARSIVNIICSGMLERHPGLQIVSVESGAGWFPFVLEALEYEMHENAPADFAQLSLTPLEYFQRQIYATTWFETRDLAYLVGRLGEDRILFESDFPHPTCLYPDPLKNASENMRDLSPTAIEKILSGNACRLYKL
ncbi:MAG: amidohydrolase [Actinobacteria bacterium]|nr:MAG: amidohydrolase [Actinomycetota bacterium]